MKNKFLIKLGFAAALALVSGPLALVAAFGFIVAPALGTSYPVANATTKSDLTTQNANLEQEIWALKVIKGADMAFQDNPLADGFMGEGDAAKAVVKITDTEKVAGSTIHVTTLAAGGGPGVYGGGTRVGAASKIQAGSFDLKIGRFWDGVGYQDVARDETMIGGRLDGMIKESLSQRHATKRNDDMLKLMIVQSEASARNKMFTVGGPSTIAGIKTQHYMDVPTIGNQRNFLTGNGALPMALGSMDSGGSRVKKYFTLGTHYALSHLKNDSDYNQLVRLAGERGDNNAGFKGNIVDIDGQAVYRWDQLDHGNWLPIGSLLAPRLYLGAALAPTFSSNTVSGGSATVQGGGSAIAAAATPTPEYTRYFSNAPWTYHWGATIAADTTTLRYIMVINPSTGVWGVFGYKVNTGTTITLFSKVVLGLTGETSDWAFPIGSLVVECNILGTPFGRTLGLGAEALLCGVGTINGNKVNPAFGRRTEFHSPHDVDHEIGMEAVWGAALVQRTDGVCPGFVVTCHSLPVSGAPVIV